MASRPKRTLNDVAETKSWMMNMAKRVGPISLLGDMVKILNIVPIWNSCTRFKPKSGRSVTTETGLKALLIGRIGFAAQRGWLRPVRICAGVGFGRSDNFVQALAFYGHCPQR